MAKKIGLFYGTQTGNTEIIAEKIRDVFGNGIVKLHDISKSNAEDFKDYECLIIGCPTWNIGDLQADWDGFYPELDEMSFAGKQVAYFGTGDQMGYADNFMDAVGILEQKITERGGKTIGYCSTNGYDFNASKAVQGNQFVGLALDEDNQPELTDQRVKEWVGRLKAEFGV